MQRPLGNPGFVDPIWGIVGVGDFTDDGKPDILWRSQSTGEVYLWVMDGTTRTGGQSLGVVPDQNWQIVGVGDFGW